MKTLFIKAALAGFLISIGCMVYLGVGGGMAGAFLFGIGLLTICRRGYALFTGRVCGSLHPDVKELLFILAGNLTVTILLGALMRYIRPEILETAVAISARKLEEGWRVVPLGAICNVLIFYAVKDFKDQPAGIFVLILCVMVFILSGSEHSIANSFYLALSGALFTGRGICYLILSVLGNALGGVLIARLDGAAHESAQQ